jgi:arylsulfate sulfotransferase
VGSFGPSDASGVALDHLGHLWINEPGAAKTVITEFDQHLNPLATINFTQGIDNGLGSANYIEDVAYGGSNTLWLAGYNGIIYHVDSAGNVLSHFDTGDPFTGIATDGTKLYTSQGTSGGVISEYSFTGGLLGTIDPGLSQGFGLAFDPTSNDLFIGGTDSITKIDLTGKIINSSFVPGANHTGLDVGLIGGTAPAFPDFLPQPVPEPSGAGLALAGLVAVLVFRKRKKIAPRSSFFLFAIALVIAGVPKAQAAITNLQLTPSMPSPQPLGMAINFQATATGAADYQFSVKGPLDSSFQLLRDFTGFGNAVWSTIDHEGIYQIQVVARNTNTGDTATLVLPFTLTSRVSGANPAVNVTPHPLVVLYSAPPCSAGSSIRVRWIAAGNVYWNVTPFKQCVAGLSMNFYIAGMLPKTTYFFQQDVFTGPRDARGPTLAFPTGATAIPTPAVTINTPAVPPSSMQQPILLHSYISTNPTVSAYAIATDVKGNVLWYALGGAYSLVRPVHGGTFLVLGNTGSPLQTHVLQEIDLVGNVIRETNASRISEQLIARGNPPISQFHHDARRLPNGNTLVLGTVEEVFSNVQGVTGSVDILGDEIMVVDPNFQLLWAWNTFDHLDINATAVLGETCKSSQPGCPPLLTPVNGMANDWTHSNSIDYSPADGSLLLSSRHQDKVYKINYGNGTGDGSILLTLGKSGDVTMSSADPYPWFSHQHDVNYESNSQFIDVYDDGNTRVAQQGATAHSRGQVLSVDPVAKTASLVLNADLGAYSPALGSAQRLLNGNYHFASGALGLFGSPPNPQAQDVEVAPTGNIVFNFQSASAEYRSFRMQSLYAE